MQTRHPLANAVVTREWDDAYTLKHRQTRVVEVPGVYWLSAVPAVLLCIGLLVAIPNPTNGSNQVAAHNLVAM